METKSLRKSLRIWLEGLTKAQTELESLNTKENQETMLRYPIVEGDWCHPQSHILERTLYFIEQTRKCAQKMISALPAERKTKVVRFVEPKAKKEKSLSEQASTKSKKGKGARSSVSDPAAPKSNRKANNKAGKSGSGTQPPPVGVEPKVRKPRNDKGKSRKKP